MRLLLGNSLGRTGYSQNEKPRRTDQGNFYDRLFKVGKGIFEIYDPVQHGIWEIYSDASSGSRFGVSIRRISNPVEEALEVAEDAAEQAANFDPTNVADARERVTADIIRRRGQPAFFKALMDAYGDACAITGCNLPTVLEAAHVAQMSRRHQRSYDPIWPILPLVTGSYGSVSAGRGRQKSAKSGLP